MTYEAILTRSFSRYEQKKLGYGALVGCFLIFLSFFTVFKPYLGPLPILNVQLSMGIAHRMFATKETESSQKQDIRVAQKATAEPELLLISTSHRENVTTKPELQLNSTDPKENATRAIPQILVNSTDHHVVKNASMESSQEAPLNHTEQPAVEIKESVPPLNSIGRQDTSLSIAENATQKTEPLCKSLNRRTDLCDIAGEVRVHAKSYTVYASSPEMATLDDGRTSWKIRPYARQSDRTAMSFVTEWSVVPASLGRREIPKCTRNHAAPAILFSAGGFAGNHFHDFSDIIVPLYLTARPFDGEVQLLVTNYRSWWASKFRGILQNLSKYPPIDIDQEKEEVHCFPSVIAGLNRHDEFGINPSLPPHTTMSDFRDFLRTSYSLKRSKAVELRAGDTRKPRLLIISRKRTRAFTNPARIAKMAKAVGFEAVVAEADMNVARFAELMNSCDAVMGVHGAGLTNILFLPDNAVLIQILPFGGAEWLSRTYFGDPSRDMNLRYLEYKIGVRESTLSDQYPIDHVALKDPRAFHKGKWDDFKKVYLGQNVKLDVRRFRPTLLKALQLLHEQRH